MVRDSIPNEFRGTFLQRESKHTEALIGRHPIDHLCERVRERAREKIED